jgi:tRNA-specific 2-thiouridylase
MVADRLGIEFHSVDCSPAFRREVIRYFVDTYANGQTPSPCIVCNRRIKFGVLLKAAESLGASALATGHYARIDEADAGRTLLKKGIDRGKDQSYFLCRLSPSQLNRAVFPLGEYTKTEVRALAEAQGLPVSQGRESQELCFVNQDTYKDFLVRHGNISLLSGPIVDMEDRVLGQHAGLHRYTVGQRRGIGIPAGEPYYVVALDAKNNRLIVGPKSALRYHRLTVVDVNWIGIDPPTRPLMVKTRLRYRHHEAISTLFPMDAKRVRVSFSEPQEAITPGQAAVFYRGDIVLGGGWIAP